MEIGCNSLAVDIPLFLQWIVFPVMADSLDFHPIMDPRLMWTTVSGPGGAEELLWLERQEGYINVFLQHHTWNKNDIFIVVSHGGQNAAPVEIALQPKMQDYM